MPPTGRCASLLLPLTTIRSAHPWTTPFHPSVRPVSGTSPTNPWRNSPVRSTCCRSALTLMSIYTRSSSPSTHWNIG